MQGMLCPWRHEPAERADDDKIDEDAESVEDEEECEADLASCSSPINLTLGSCFCQLLLFNARHD